MMSFLLTNPIHKDILNLLIFIGSLSLLKTILTSKDCQISLTVNFKNFIWQTQAHYYSNSTHFFSFYKRTRTLYTLKYKRKKKKTCTAVIRKPCSLSFPDQVKFMAVIHFKDFSPHILSYNGYEITHWNILKLIYATWNKFGFLFPMKRKMRNFYLGRANGCKTWTTYLQQF